MKTQLKLKTLAFIACLGLVACVSTPPKVMQVSNDGKRVTMELSKDNRSLLANSPSKAALTARDDLLARKDLTVALMASVAELSMLSGRLEEAQAQARAALKKDFKNVAAMQTLVKISILNNKFEEALLMAENALVHDARNADTLSLRGLANYMAGRSVEAREDWKKCLEYNPLHIPSQMNLAALYFQGRYINLAGSTFEKVLAMQPANLDAQVGKALVLNAQGNASQARTLLLTVLDKNPKSPLVLYNLASIERDRFQNYEVALKYIEQYLDIQTQDRMSLERAVAQREELRYLVAKKKTNMSDEELRKIANRSSQAINHPESGEPTNVAQTPATQAPQPKKTGPKPEGSVVASKKEPAAKTDAKPAPAAAETGTPNLATDDAKTLEDAIK